MANEYSTVACHEEIDTLKLAFNETNPNATVVLCCAWTDRNSLISDILGNQRILPHATPGLVLRARECTNLQPRSVDRNTDPSSQMCDWSTEGQALLTFTYDALLEEVASETFEPNATFYPLDHKLFRWGSATGDFVRKEESGGFLVKGAIFTRTIFRLETADIPAGLLSYFGKVNDSALVGTVVGLTFPEETLLFEASVFDTKIRADGQRLTDLSLRWAFREQGWNKFYRPDTNSWESMFIAGGAEYKPYEPADMSDLF